MDLNAVVADAVDRLRLTAEDRGIALRVGGRVDAVVHGDQDQLMTAVRNLVDNAVRYSPEGTTVGIGLSSVDGLAQVTVTDQGIGISPEEQERVFERFYRVDAARSRQTGGTGLGLSIVKHVVINHGGEVTLWSQPGRGSTFTIRLPEWGRCRRRRRAGCRPRHRAARSPGDRLGRTPDPEGDERMSRILIVEDEESFSDPLSYLLEKEGSRSPSPPTATRR